jgi:PAS domain-containing protein
LPRWKAEERLKESEEKYRSLVDNIAVGVYRSTGDSRGRFIWGNSSLVRILGYPSLDTLKTIDRAPYHAAMRKGDYTISFRGAHSDPIEIDEAYYMYLHSSEIGKNNYSRYNNKK